MDKSNQKKMLLELRSKLVGKLHVHPFTVYRDDTIELLLEQQPKSIDELTKIKGFPKDGKRVKGFGLAIVAIFNNTKEEGKEVITGKVMENELERVTGF